MEDREQQEQQQQPAQTGGGEEGQRRPFGPATPQQARAVAAAAAGRGGPRTARPRTALRSSPPGGSMSILGEDSTGIVPIEIQSMITEIEETSRALDQTVQPEPMEESFSVHPTSPNFDDEELQMEALVVRQTEEHGMEMATEDDVVPFDQLMIVPTDDDMHLQTGDPTRQTLEQIQSELAQPPQSSTAMVLVPQTESEPDYYYEFTAEAETYLDNDPFAIPDMNDEEFAIVPMDTQEQQTALVLVETTDETNPFDASTEPGGQTLHDSAQEFALALTNQEQQLSMIPFDDQIDPNTMPDYNYQIVPAAAPRFAEQDPFSMPDMIEQYQLNFAACTQIVPLTQNPFDASIEPHGQSLFDYYNEGHAIVVVDSNESRLVQFEDELEDEHLYGGTVISSTTERSLVLAPPREIVLVPEQQALALREQPPPPDAPPRFELSPEGQAAFHIVNLDEYSLTDRSFASNGAIVVAPPTSIVVSAERQLVAVEQPPAPPVQEPEEDEEYEFTREGEDLMKMALLAHDQLKDHSKAATNQVVVAPVSGMVVPPSTDMVLEPPPEPIVVAEAEPEPMDIPLPEPEPELYEEDEVSLQTGDVFETAPQEPLPEPLPEPQPFYPPPIPEEEKSAFTSYSARSGRSSQSGNIRMLLRPSIKETRTDKQHEVEVSMNGFLHQSRPRTPEIEITESDDEEAGLFDDPYQYHEKTRPKKLSKGLMGLTLMSVLFLIGTVGFFGAYVGPFIVDERLDRGRNAMEQFEQVGLQGESDFILAGATNSSEIGGVPIWVKQSFLPWRVPYSGQKVELPTIWAYEQSGGEAVAETMGRCLGKTSSGDGPSHDKDNIFAEAWTSNVS